MGIKTDSNVEQIVLKPPTYLKQFCIDDNEIILIFKKEGSLTTEDDSIVKCENLDSINDNLDLTGNPLEVDLNGDDSLGSIIKCERGFNWTSYEARLHPITIQQAMSLMNLSHKTNFSETNFLPMYCLCDGTDNEKTVILGSQFTKSALMTCLINLIGCVPRDHEFVNLEYMKEKHFLNTKGKAKIDYLIKRKYVIYGYNLQGIKLLENSENIGCVAVEVVSKSPNENNLSEQNINMILQVILGHESSTIHFLWQQLCDLQNYCDILASSSKCLYGDTIIHVITKNESEIYNEINDLLNTIHFLQKDCNGDFDINNLREQELLDELWKVLKHCKDLSTLKNCFTYFFEMLADSNGNTQINQSDKSNIARIVSSILDGKVMVPTLTFSQSLELLFELASEKLLKDYLAISNHFNLTSQHNILKQWNQFDNDNNLTGKEFRRKTRMTMIKKGTMTESANNTFKLRYLKQMHTTLEMLFLLKEQVNLSQYNFNYFCDSVYNEYLNCTKMKSEGDLMSNRLAEFSFDLRSLDDLVEKDCLDTWTVKMVSTLKKMEITTVFNLSENPIFPPCVFDDSFDVGLGKSFHISQFSKFVHML